jgi:V-type H+-transporting ATPase subunit F
VDEKTNLRDIEDAFRAFTTREDVAVVLISQYVADMIRPLVNRYTKAVPAVLEIPSKDHPYDPSKDSILSRVKFMFGDEEK